jgi:hypothetical protein
LKLPGMTFLLGLTGWSGSGFTSTGGFDLLAEAAAANDNLLEPSLALLRERQHASIDDVATSLNRERSPRPASWCGCAGKVAPCSMARRALSPPRAVRGAGRRVDLFSA